MLLQRAECAAWALLWRVPAAVHWLLRPRPPALQLHYQQMQQLLLQAQKQQKLCLLLAHLQLLL